MLALISAMQNIIFNLQAGMFPVVSRRWKASPKKRTVWDNLDSDSDYEPSGDEEEIEDEEETKEAAGEMKAGDAEREDKVRMLASLAPWKRIIW